MECSSTQSEQSVWCAAVCWPQNASRKWIVFKTRLGGVHGPCLFVRRYADPGCHCRSSSMMVKAEVSISPSKMGTTAKVTPRSPYVEDETDEEFLPDAPPSDVDLDERICRICFSGQEEVQTQGKLISPCKCRYVPILDAILNSKVVR